MTEMWRNSFGETNKNPRCYDNTELSEKIGKLLKIHFNFCGFGLAGKEDFKDRGQNVTICFTTKLSVR